jgi:hypothetical protein
LALGLTLSTESEAFLIYNVTTKDVVGGSVCSDFIWETLSPFGGLCIFFIDSEECETEASDCPITFWDLNFIAGTFGGSVKNGLWGDFVELSTFSFIFDLFFLGSDVSYSEEHQTCNKLFSVHKFKL